MSKRKYIPFSRSFIDYLLTGLQGQRVTIVRLRANIVLDLRGRSGRMVPAGAGVAVVSRRLTNNGVSNEQY